MIIVVLCPGTPEGSTGSGSGFKASQKTGQRHCRTGSPLARTNLSPFARCTLGLSRHFY